jgi:hypothetical protein
MTKQTTPHTQTEQNVNPEQTDLDINESRSEEEDKVIYARMEGAETGTDRSPRKVPVPKEHHVSQPETTAHEGAVTTRTPHVPTQGITSRSAEEESSRQNKVVNERPDAQAGVNHSK